MGRGEPDEKISIWMKFGIEIDRIMVHTRCQKQNYIKYILIFYEDVITKTIQVTNITDEEG